jgi:hypothetical protein
VKNYIIHDVDGNILRTGSCPENMLELQVNENEFLLEGVANDLTQLVNVSTNELQVKPVDTEALQTHFQDELRVIRDSLLTSSDWTQITDTVLNALQKTEWQEYRQALRDLPLSYLTETDLDNVVFPVKPTA